LTSDLSIGPTEVVLGISSTYFIDEFPRHRSEDRRMVSFQKDRR